MRQPSRLVVLFIALLFTTPVWAGAPLAFVSTGTNVSGMSNIYSVDTSAGTTQLLVSTANADYEGLVVLPGTTGNIVVYACDPTNGVIVRFDPASPGTVETIFIKGVGGLQSPQCGRGTSDGSLIVTDAAAGGGWYEFKGIAGIAVGSAGNQTPTKLIAAPPAGSVSEGTALKNAGDLLIVDSAHNQVFRSPAPLYSTETTFISKGLSTPLGIARRSDSQMYVSNNSSSPFIEHFDALGNVAASCQTLSFSGNNKVKSLGFMQMSPADTLFVAATSRSGNSGILFVIDASPSTGCLSVTNTLATGLPPLVGVALALPNFPASKPLTAATGEIANFGYAALQVLEAGSCDLTTVGGVTATLTPPATLMNEITTNGIPAVPAPDLGWDGFETVLDPDPTAVPLDTFPAACLATDGLFHSVLYVDVASTVTNPLPVFCHDALDANCFVAGSSGAVLLDSVYPFGGILPSDFGTGTKKSISCRIFLTNSTAPPTNKEPGTFCLYESPVNNTYSATTGTQNLNLASKFSVGKTVGFKFKLANAPPLGNCKNGGYITDSVALISIVQVADANGNPVSVPMDLTANGQGTIPLYETNKTNQQNSFNWNTSSCTLPSGVTQLCPAGTYSITTYFLSNNTSAPDVIGQTLSTFVILQ